jgi:iron-sulfur cluster assembly protein
MITLTDNAVGLIRRLTDQPGMPGEAGVRIARSSRPGSLSAHVTDRPYDGDDIVNVSGARLFLDAAAAEVLADKALDASIVDGSVAFAVTEQSDGSEDGAR